MERPRRTMVSGVTLHVAVFFFSFFVRGAVVLPGHVTPFPWLSILSLFHCETRQLSRYPCQVRYSTTPTTGVFQNLEVESLYCHDSKFPDLKIDFTERKNRSRIHCLLAQNTFTISDHTWVRGQIFLFCVCSWQQSVVKLPQ